MQVVFASESEIAIDIHLNCHQEKPESIIIGQASSIICCDQFTLRMSIFSTDFRGRRGQDKKGQRLDHSPTSPILEGNVLHS